MIDPTFAGLLDRPAGFADRPLAWDDAGETWLSERAVAERALALAAQLEAADKRLAFLFATNTVETLVRFLALAAAGHAVALIDPGLADDKLAHLLALYQPEILLGAPAGLSVPPGGQGAPIARELGVLLLTSGTTGSAKFVRLSWQALAINARQIAESLDLTSASTAIAHLPFHYSYGLSVVTSHLVSGGRVAFLDDAATSAGFWTKVAASGGTHFPGVPFHYTVLARLGFDVVPAAVDTFTQAGGALDPRIQAAILDRVEARRGRFFAMYGQTEAAPRIACLPSERMRDRLGSVGLAMPGGHISILGPDDAPLPAGETGRVVYEGPNVMLGYAESRADLAQGDVLAGRLDTGDLGRLDAGGFLHLSGRTARFAKIAGLRLSLDDIERELAPAVCADMGDRVAVVFEGAVPPDVRERTRALALSSRIPPTSFVARAVPALPRKSSGKIDHALLKAMLDV